MKKLKLSDIRVIMMLVNFIAVISVPLFIYLTTEKICNDYTARDFLDQIQALPHYPFRNIILIGLLFFLLIISFFLREKVYVNHTRFVYFSLLFDFIISIIIVVLLHFNYNGIFFLVFAGIISYARGNRGKYLMIALALISLIATDSDLLSINYKLYSLENYFNYYNSTAHQYLVGGYNFLNSLNTMLFIVYCILLIQKQKGTIDEVNMLYEQIRKTNADLQNANSQLEEYAKITERMGETRERNRIAREIHDTLGHTLTGISVGIEACIATAELSPSKTKEHLQKISAVARNGLLDIRRSINELKPDALERLSLETAITKMITDMKSATDMQIFFDCRVKPLKFDEDEESAIYRVIQESLTNSMRHGKASRVWIVMDKEDSAIVLTIKDDGIGCTEIKSGFGTKHITERIHMLNGDVTFESKDGFCVTAKIPIRWGETYD